MARTELYLSSLATAKQQSGNGGSFHIDDTSAPSSPVNVENITYGTRYIIIIRLCNHVSCILGLALANICLANVYVSLKHVEGYIHILVQGEVRAQRPSSFLWKFE